MSITSISIGWSPEPVYILDVPTVEQTHDMDCWHKAALMISRFKAPGFVIPDDRRAVWVLQQVAADDGVTTFGDKFRMARAFGLRAVRRPAFPQIDKHTIFRWLRDYGPICCMMRWERIYTSLTGIKAMPAYGHCIVLTGIENEHVHFWDPEVYGDEQGAARQMHGERRMSVTWFRDHLSPLPRALLYKPG